MKKGKKKEQKIFDNTEEITADFSYWFALKENLPKIMEQGLFSKRISVSDKIIYLRELAQASAKYWNAVYRTYPEVRGKNVSGDISVIKIT